MRMPGDEFVAQPQILTNHAITIKASSEEVWPWLTQMGWHLGGWYTPEWVDQLLFPQNWRSLDHLDPALLRNLEVGDTIPDGPADTAEFVVVEVDAPHALVLRSTTHLPPTWQEKLGAEIDWTWSFWLTRLPGGRSRLQLRVRGRTAPRWLTDLPGHNDPGRLPHGRWDAARHQTARRIWRVGEAVRQVTSGRQRLDPISLRAQIEQFWRSRRGGGRLA